MFRDHRLLANIVQQEAAGAICIFCTTGRESALTDQRGGLIAQAACYSCSFQRAGSEFPVFLGMGGGDDFGEVQLLGVKVEEGD